MLKYSLVFIVFVFSIVSVFARELNDGFLIWKNPPVISGSFILQTNISPFMGTSTGKENLTWSEISETSQEVPAVYAPPQSYFQKLSRPIQTNVFYDDLSLLRFVSRYRSLSDIDYTPPNLESISGSYINEAGRKSYLRWEAKEALDTLAKAFYDQFGEPLTVVSGYRSAAYQKRLWDLGRCTDSLCAPPGFSEHQLGLAIDVFDASTEKDFEANKRYKKYIAWLKSNAHLYGWTQSYQKWVAIDTYQVEPWHWRFIGVPMATRLKELWWSYAEYVNFQETLQNQ